MLLDISNKQKMRNKYLHYNILNDMILMHEKKTDYLFLTVGIFFPLKSVLNHTFMKCLALENYEINDLLLSRSSFLKQIYVLQLDHEMAASLIECAMHKNKKLFWEKLHIG